MNTDSDGKICFVLVHNHKFERNIPKIESLYDGKFSNLFHLVPFYQGDKPNVIRVDETSHCFQGFFAQGKKTFARKPADYYIFCGDDLLLNPSLNEGNIIEALGLGPETGYIKSIESLDKANLRWPNFADALFALGRGNGANWESELPSFEEAATIFERHCHTVGRLRLRHLSRGIQPWRFVLMLYYFVARYLRKTKRPETDILGFPYPLAWGYSDFLVVPRSAIDAFCHYCGVFAAAGLFAEIAIPTALTLSCQTVRVESETQWRGVEFWNNDAVAMEKLNEFSLKRLFASYKENQLYVHPVKLSRWS